MRVSHLSLNNFRNYGRLELPLSPGATLLIGDNAQGKTNLLEALHYLATTRSPHASQDNQLVNWEASQSTDPLSAGRLVVDLASSGPPKQLEMRLILERREKNQVSFRREALVNKRKVRLMDLIGQMQVVLFLPEDVGLVTGPPSERRRFLDITLCQVNRQYCRTLSQYNKVLEQRNVLLRQLAEGKGNQDVLEILTEKLVGLGRQVFAIRAGFFSAIADDFQRIHFEELTGGRETLHINYLPRLQPKINGSNGEEFLEDSLWMMAHQDDLEAIGQKFSEALESSRLNDIQRGSTSIGPHRDDWRFVIDGRDLGNYGSRGQQRSAILALKMTQINWMTELTGESPILLLDEVLAELDESRRQQLLSYVQKAEQAILTATDPGMFSKEFLDGASQLAVKQGTIQSLPSSSNPDVN
jgi:DNA replication and repair protein RecF